MNGVMLSKPVKTLEKQLTLINTDQERQNLTADNPDWKEILEKTGRVGNQMISTKQVKNWVDPCKLV
jgi:hypothetical protein